MEKINTLGLILFIVFALVALICLIYPIYLNVMVVKKKKEVDYPSLIKKEIFFILGFSLSFTLMMASIYLMNNMHPKGHEVFFAVFFGALFSLAIATLINTFILHYYGLDFKDNYPSLDKKLFIFMMASIPIFLISLLYMSNGYAAYWEYPIPNMLSFSDGFIYDIAGGSQGIAFYALFILGGAIFVYLLCDHRFYQQYGKHGLLESTFLVAFPSGIFWARVGYVIGNFSKEFAPRFPDKWWSIFAIWEGGITIIWGAVGGIVVGALWFLRFRKGYSLALAADIVVPTILLAQAIGRWGNFFNCEVHGEAVDASYWSWLPIMIVRNGAFSSASDAPSLIVGEKMYLPLFFIEACINLVGYFVLAKLFGKLWRKNTELADLAYGYIVWYGLTRTILEPFRYGDFKMGSHGYWSWIWAMIFVFVGSALIAFNHIYRHFKKKKNNTLVFHGDPFKKGVISASIISVISLIGIVIGAIMMSQSEFALNIVYNKFNIGLIILVCSLSLLMYLSISVILIKEGVRRKREAL